MDPFFGMDTLFNAMNMNTPSRSTPDQSTPASRRAWSRRRAQNTRNPFDLFSQSDANLADIMRGQYYDQEPYGTPRIEEVDDYDEASRSHRPRAEYPSTHPSGCRPPMRLSDMQSRGPTFAVAARAMHAALVCANQECRSIETSFEAQTRQLLSWLPAAYLNSLWMIRLSWNGRSENSPTIIGTATRSGSSEVITYDGVVQRFNTALAAIKTCAPPDRSSTRLPLGWEVLGSTMRKLQISLEAIEELLVLIKTQRDRMPLLLHEIGSAQHLLESVREVWETSTKAGKRPDASSSSSSTQPPRRSDHEWPGFERFDYDI